MFKHILNFIFPLTCGVCGRLLDPDGRSRICDGCRDRITYSRSRVFPLPSWLDDVYTCCSYEGVIRKCIHLLKYSAKEYMARPLGAIMVDCLEDGIDTADVDVFVPVPLHRRNRARRGYNQSALLIKELVKVHEREVSAGNLIRIRNTRSQVGLSGEDRIKNMADAFLIRDPRKIEGKSIMLVDDVCTTGSTLNECARLLKSAGAKRVCGIVLAHGK